MRAVFAFTYCCMFCFEPCIRVAYGPRLDAVIAMCRPVYKSSPKITDPKRQHGRRSNAKLPQVSLPPTPLSPSAFTSSITVTTSTACNIASSYDQADGEPCLLRQADAEARRLHPGTVEGSRRSKKKAPRLENRRC